MDGPRPQCREVKVGRPVVLSLVLLLVFVLYLALLTLQVEYRPPLRMVERRGAVEGAEEES